MTDLSCTICGGKADPMQIKTLVCAHCGQGTYRYRPPGCKRSEVNKVTSMILLFLSVLFLWPILWVLLLRCS